MRTLFRLDPRSLACLRVGLGLVLLWDMGRALRVAGDWWALQGYVEPPLPDWLLLGGGAATLRLAAVAVALVAVALVLGWHTRLATVGAWVSACGYQFAASVGADYHNAVLCTLLLWSLALPTGARWSLDARAGRGADHAPWLARVGGAGLLLSLAWIYLYTAAAKSGPAWWGEGTAIWYAWLDRGAETALGRWLGTGLPGPVLQAATWAVLLLEWVAAPLLVWPRSRAAAVAALVVLHLGMWATMDLGSFPLVMLAGLAALLPAAAWDRLCPWLTESRRQPGAGHSAASARHRLADVATAVVIGLALAVSLAGGAVATAAERQGDWPGPGARQMARLRHLLGLELRWMMYAPEPNRDTGWWVVLAWRRDGTVIDPLTARLPDLVPPRPGGPGWRRRWMAVAEGPWLDPGGRVPQRILRDYLLRSGGPGRSRGDPAATWDRLGLVWVYEPLIPFRAPRVRRPLLVLAWPDRAVTPRQASQVLGVDVVPARFDADGELVPPPLSVAGQPLP